ncbi:hypothetical protein BKA01_005557 [Pseudonocardia eucalypti]|uniref:hypothetical protein n=1 Tax=Pseudonocardia eucalypti TaxID=648755 RepID=UPI00161D0BB0|nr:hypothetical protein [Pseudonocardia eucalypti]
MADIDADPSALWSRAARISALAHELAAAAEAARVAGIQDVPGGGWSEYADQVLAGTAADVAELAGLAAALHRRAAALAGADTAVTERLSAIRRCLG